MLTEKDYCDYDTCVALKELGYKVPTSAFYIPNDTTLYFISNPMRGGFVIDCFYSHNSLREDVVSADWIDAPTMWEAQKWLRENKNMDVNAFYDNIDATWRFYILEIDSPDLSGTYAYKDAFMSYEEALLEGIKEAVKILAIC